MPFAYLMSYTPALCPHAIMSLCPHVQYAPVSYLWHFTPSPLCTLYNNSPIYTFLYHPKSYISGYVPHIASLYPQSKGKCFKKLRLMVHANIDETHSDSSPFHILDLIWKCHKLFVETHAKHDLFGSNRKAGKYYTVALRSQFLIHFRSESCNTVCNTWVKFFKNGQIWYHVFQKIQNEEA